MNNANEAAAPNNAPDSCTGIYSLTGCALCPVRVKCAVFTARPRGDKRQNSLTLLRHFGQGKSQFARALEAHNG